jgi:hypothetical protein
MSDGEEPGPQVAGAAQPGVGTQGGKERLLEAVLGVGQTDGGDEEAKDIVAVLVEDRLKGRQLGPGHTQLTVAPQKT